ncbi:hypothetical protein P154DRAFT_581615 [Amniculicola lignicola CBS 123094]|uniref:Uncharacterized protein n=1 Tax=Amniculicola lignicola CBS 123094 TaxID=1392246 RepID=A0A6A5W0F9_9PLEO|nr:hypothetical protein P154DRAFT_581615 [Amniculicola lignicola CBS 123094]
MVNSEVRGEDIAIVGSGCRFPGHATSPSKLWDILRDPHVLAETIPKDRFSGEGFYHPDGQYHGHFNVKEGYFLAGEGVHCRFDAFFFGMNPAEAMCLDPQCRLLLEVVYEAMEAAGLTIKALQGSDTAMYTGQMVADYDQILARDTDHSLGIYHASGTSHAILSNRISYFFDWHGPSMTIDTACSSSLVALHQAVQQLRTGQSRVAVAAGTNMILDPKCFISLASLNMLSPDGRCRMWDADAKGYARGEGVAAVILKTVKAALEDGDDIECIIRETATGQDGRTQGITSPNPAAQTSLIRQTYAQAGLDLSNPVNRPQFFECHGTGTLAGDAAEAQAITTALFPTSERQDCPEDSTVLRQKLWVGSIKSIIGHTEGTAGIAGVLKAALALKNSTVPPNLLFENLNPRIKPFYKNVKVSTRATPWPTLPKGEPRRASVNSFGFGGANVHAILESYEPTIAEEKKDTMEAVFTPFVFSALSEASLRATLARYQEYLKKDGAEISLRDLSYTLRSRRSVFQFTTAITASDVGGLVSAIDGVLQEDTTSTKKPSIRRVHRENDTEDHNGPSILGIFTGQGAQWVGMGSALIQNSKAARQTISRLENRLSNLPPADRPAWSLSEELLKDASSSRMSEATISQPLCTAVQILQVDLLRAAAVKLAAVVGHSSGEIGAAYASGFLTAEDAICVAYYRGLHSRLAGHDGMIGSMMAVGTSVEDAQDLCNEPEVQGRVSVAAINSSVSITLSGDQDAIEELKVILDDEKKFARALKVDKAYHSHHMKPCTDAYIASLASLGIKEVEQDVEENSTPTWFSSVFAGEDMRTRRDAIPITYWNDNMVNPVLFQQAMRAAQRSIGQFALAIEIGPHPALQGPVLQTVQDLSMDGLPYTSLFRRGISAVESVADCFGYIWSYFGGDGVNLESHDTFVSGKASKNRVVKGLPTYAWDHGEFWNESRCAKAFRLRPGPLHELLGHMTPDSNEQDLRWRHVLKPSEIPWLIGHKLQDQIVFPAAGYVATALEAAMAVCNYKHVSASLVEVFDIEFGRALVFDDSSSTVEVIVSMADIKRVDPDGIEAQFRYHGSDGEGDAALNLFSHGRIRISIGEAFDGALPAKRPTPPNLINIPAEDFYSASRDLEYQWAGPFIGLNKLKRKLGYVEGYIEVSEPTEMLLHPAVIDVAFQGVMLAYSYPDDGQLWSIHVPGRVGHLSINPALCKIHAAKEPLRFVATHYPDTQNMTGNTELYAGDLSVENAILQIEDMDCVPLARAAPHDDREIFATIEWGLAEPDAGVLPLDFNAGLVEQHKLIPHLERLTAYYMRKIQKEIPMDHAVRSQGPHTHLLRYVNEVVGASGQNGGKSFLSRAWENDTLKQLASASEKLNETIDMQLLHAVATSIMESPQITSTMDVGVDEQLLRRFHKDASVLRIYQEQLVGVMKQLVHRNPGANVLQIGTGTGAAAQAILAEVSSSFASYTITDVPSEHFEHIKTEISAHQNQVVFNTLDIGLDPVGQGFLEQSFDVVVAFLALRAKPNLRESLRNVRRLLKPGCSMIVVEMLPTVSPAHGFMFGALPRWWDGVPEDQSTMPVLDLTEWDSLLRETGFSGCDTTTAGSFDENGSGDLALFVTQAMDEKTSFLRNPLSTAFMGLFQPKSLIEDLIILGGKTLKTTRSAKLAPYKSFRDMDMNPNTTALSLAQIDSTVFQTLNDADWESLKAMLMSTGVLLWVTQGRRAQNPYAAMMVGLLRSIIREVPTLNYRMLGFEDVGEMTAHSLAASLLQFSGEYKFLKDGELHTSVENDIVIAKGGQAIIPRLAMNEDLNRRYNSYRRGISRLANHRTENICMVSDSDKLSYQLVEEPFHSCGSNDGNLIRLEVTASLLSAIRVGTSTYLFPLWGREIKSGDLRFGLSVVNSSIVNLSKDSSIVVKVEPENEAEMFSLNILDILASNILRDLSAGDSILLYEPDARIEWQADYTHPTRLSTGRHTPFNSHECDTTSTPHQHICFCGSSDVIKRRFNGGKNRFPFAIPLSAREYQHIVCHDILATFEIPSSLFSVMNWAECEEVSVQIHPITHRIAFSHDKTYWLAGLSGGLGLALCEWMVRHGARHFVISSRNPQIHPDWLQEMGNLGATVKIASCDLTVKERVVSLHREVCETMPAIAGVCQGSMVLVDTAIRDMTRENFLDGTRPKIEGSIHLDDLFLEDTLEFFVFFSSVVSAIGRPGQANYSAANMFMASLAEQRRQKGLAASVIHIGAIYGVGYAAQSERMIYSRAAFRSWGLVPTSERDFYEMFTEAVVAGLSDRSGQSGRNKSRKTIEILNGLCTIDTHTTDRPVWESEPFMSHFVRHSSNTGQAISTSQSKVPVKTQLAEAINRDQVYSIIQEALLPKLYSLFQIDPLTVDKETMSAMRLVEIGIDSLLAVDIRGWFVKTLEVNIPVLKILSGVPIRDLILMAVETIPERLTPGLTRLQNEDINRIDNADLAAEDNIARGTRAEPRLTQTYDKGPSVSSDAGSDETLVPLAKSPSSVFQKTLRLSFSQEMFWFVWEFLKDRTSLNHTAWARISGTLRIPDLKRAFEIVGQRHEILRTSIIEKDGKPAQFIMSTSSLELEVRSIVNEEEVRSSVDYLQDKHVYDVAHRHTVRVILLSMSSNEHFLVGGLHPLVADGISFQSLLKVVQQLYTTGPGRSERLAASHLRQYSEYSEKQHVDFAAGAMDADLRFWTEEFSWLPPPLPILTLSSLTSRPDLTVYENIRARFSISLNTKTQLHAVCRRYRITPFHFYLATFRALLLRFSPAGDGEDLVVGIGDANRLEDEMIDVIGPFVNFLPLRLQAEGSTKFTDLLQHTREKVYSAMAHSQVPFRVLLNELGVSRSSTYTSLFQCFVNYRQGMQRMTPFNAPTGEKAALHAVNIGLPKVAYDVTLEMVDYADGECTQEILMRKDMYNQADVNRLAESYERLITSFIEDPTSPLNHPDVYKQEEIIDVIKFTRGPSWSSQWPETVVHRIDEIAKMEPNETAIWLGKTRTSYVELQTHVNAIASSLSDASVAVGSTVAVMMEPNAAFIASLLGVIHAGAVYLPLELSWPWPRLATIVADCQPSAILVDEDSMRFVDNLQQPGVRFINISRVDMNAKPPPILARARDAAALLYTSGSSGAPKGIYVKHEGLRNWVEHATKICDIGTKEVVLQQTTPTFDISLIQMLTALCRGGSLCLIPREQRGDAQVITSVMSSRGVTLTCATPSEYSIWLQFSIPEVPSSLTAWRTAFSIGEPIPPALMGQISSAGLANLSFYNLYGPTEASLAATAMLVPASLDKGPIAAGPPLPNYSVYVLDEELRLVPADVQGEIYIGGAGVGLGYHNRPQQTARMFVPNVFATPEDKALGWDIMHRTGDLGRWREDGVLLIEGRIDTQIKIRGLRIDLSEIEHAIMDAAQGAVREVVVTPRELPSGQSTVLVAHAMFDDAADVGSTTSTIRCRLSERLPQYMCPGIIIGMERLPRTSAAKLDRRSLATLPLDLEIANLVSSQTEKSSEPQTALTPTETQLRDIWTQILDSRLKIVASTDFFHVGGSSMLLLELQKRIVEVFGIRMPLVAMFRVSTLNSMAEWLDHGARGNADDQNIDWKEETSLPSTLLDLDLLKKLTMPFPPSTTPGLTVILTGATGKLGRGILDSVLADARIDRVHCIGVRNAQKMQGVMATLGNKAAKVMFHEGDLALPRLGLSKEEASTLFATTDIVIHNGSDMSYLKTYATLCAVNLQSTKALVEMCALYGSGKHIPFHYVSTVSVGNVATWGSSSSSNTSSGTPASDGFVLHPVSVAEYEPPPIASISDIAKTAHGYITTKWASEVFLECLHRRYPNWPVVIHRPSLISREQEDTSSNVSSSLEFVENMRQYAALLNAIPTMPFSKTGGRLSISGSFDVVSVQGVVEGMAKSLFEQNREGLTFLHHLGGVELRLGDVRSWLPKDGNEGSVGELELGEWTQRAVELGMHPTMESLLQEIGLAKGRLIIPQNSLV